MGIEPLVADLSVRRATWGIVALILAGCGTTKTSVKPVDPTARVLPPGPSAAQCDPQMCAIYCVHAACDATREACLARCEDVCGDGYFDDRDGDMVACALSATDATRACNTARKCCDVEYTSQLCPL